MDEQVKDFLEQFKEVIITKIDNSDKKIEDLGKDVKETNKIALVNSKSIIALDTEIKNLKEKVKDEDEDEKGDRINFAAWRNKVDDELRKVWFYIGKQVGFNTLIGGSAAIIVSVIFKALG